MLSVLILLLLPGSSFCAPKDVRVHVNLFSEKTRKALATLIKTVVDTIRATEVDMESMEQIRVNNRNSPAFEMGYLMKSLQENYRMQLEKFLVAKHMGTRLYTPELIILLVEIEHHYWEAEHLCNMIHEIERKWGIKVDGLDYDAFLAMELQEEKKHLFTSPRHRLKIKHISRWKVDAALSRHRDVLLGHATSSVITKKRTGSWWPKEYGWEIDYYW